MAGSSAPVHKSVQIKDLQRVTTATRRILSPYVNTDSERKTRKERQRNSGLVKTMLLLTRHHFSQMSARGLHSPPSTDLAKTDLDTCVRYAISSFDRNLPIVSDFFKPNASKRSKQSCGFLCLRQCSSQTWRPCFSVRGRQPRNTTPLHPGTSHSPSMTNSFLL